MEFSDFIQVFPNIHLIEDLHKEGKYQPFLIANNDFIPPVKMTHYSYGFTNKNIKWMTVLNNYERIIKSIELGVCREMIHYNLQNPPPIHIKPISQQKPLSPDLIHMETGTLVTDQILILPKLNHLMQLDINFCGFMEIDGFMDEYFDERIFEQIHQSCPQLEILTFVFFHMNISDYFDTMIMNGELKPANRLKVLDISGQFFDSRCLTYLSQKHPQIHSLKLTLATMTLSRRHSEPYKKSVYNMLMNLHLLKKLKVRLFDSCESHRHDNRMLQSAHRINEEFWPNEEFLQWFLEHPKQLNHFAYDNSLIENYDEHTEHFIVRDANMTAEGIYEDIINKVVYKSDFLNHLTCLTLTAKFSIDILYAYLLQNDQSPTLSTSIKELVIDESSSYTTEYPIHIYDWLDVLPNLTSLKIKASKVVDGIDYSNNNSNLKKRDRYEIAIKLLELIKQRKQQQLVLSDISNNKTYKLKKLAFKNASICMKGGLNGLFKKCSHLKTLKFHHTNYTISEWESKTGVFFDLSNIHLDYLHIMSLRYMSGSNSFENDKAVNNLYINETALNKISSILAELSPYDTITSVNLNLVCKYIDKIAFETHMGYPL
ncbi:unnamed protein product [Cunninghamella blakesleeana]